MGYQVGVLEALRDWGLTVHEVDGCRTRGSSSFWPKGHVVHHDVIADRPGTDDPVPSIMLTGRPDLAPPLCNFWLETDGDVHVVALGRANHAGRGSWNGLVGNSSVWGTEMNNLGTSAYPWPDVQLDAAVRLCAATADFSGFGEGYVCGHKEWAPDRKPDPHDIDMDGFRRDVAELLIDGPHAEAHHPTEDDMILRCKGYKPPIYIGSTPHLVPGPFVARYAEARKGDGIVDLPDTPAGRSHYDRVNRLVTPWYRRVLRAKVA